MSILSVIIPVYNEENAINLILDKVQVVELIGGVQKEVIIINDGSTDNTEKAIKDFIHSHPGFDLRYIVHQANKGKGAAIHTGINEATGDFIIIQEVDLGFEPEEYNLLLNPLLNGMADVVYGSRFIGGKPHRIHLFWHSFENKLHAFLSNMFSNLNLSDLETRYKMYKSDIIKNASLVENHSGFEHEIIQRISRVDGIRIYEAGISYDGRTYDEVKKNKWQDGFRALYFSAKYGLTPGRKPVSGINSQREMLLPGKLSKMKGFLILALLAAIFFSTGFHNSAKHYRYPGFQSIFQSDGLGYYQYLPAIFLQHDIVRGQHYCVTLADGRLLNKYSIGVSYLQAPFFFMANVWQYATNNADNGYSATYGFFILLGALIYCFLALLLIYKTLLPRFGFLVSFLVPVLLFYGTNLIFYTLHESAMSHVYVFFLFALFAYRTPFFYQKPSFGNALWLAIPLGIITVIRQYNLVVILYLFLYNITSWSDIRERFLYWLSKWYYGVFFIFTILLFFIPQMIYWHMVIGKWYIYAYGYAQSGPERFLYLSNPKIFEVIGGKVSGIYTYAPVLILSLAGMIMMAWKKSIDVWAIIAIHLITLYLISSWWCYAFDCGFGHRAFIDYYALFAIPMAFTLKKIINLRKLLLNGFLTATLVFLMYLNIRLSMMYGWDPCWTAPGWTWKHYTNVIHKAAIGGDYRRNYHKME